jgi:hypothetical protein
MRPVGTKGARMLAQDPRRLWFAAKLERRN